MPGAAVSVISDDTGLRRRHNQLRRSLQFPHNECGRYTLRVRHDHFKTTEIRNVIVQVGQTATVDVQLAIGSLAQKLVVEAAAPVFRPSESSMTTVVTREFIESLPLSGRRYTDFVLLAPNATADGEAGHVSIGGQQGSSDSGYHNGNGANFFTVDGANATSSFFGDARGGTNVPYIFGEQSIEEFQVTATPYSASYGGAGTGFINTVTKSGADVLHGDAFYYLRHSATAANDVVDKASGFAKPLDVLEQFGADLGGRLIRRKLWFYVDYEQQRRKEPISIVDPGVDESFFLNVPPGTPLPAPNGTFPVPNTFTRAPCPETLTIPYISSKSRMRSTPSIQASAKPNGVAMTWSIFPRSTGNLAPAITSLSFTTTTGSILRLACSRSIPSLVWPSQLCRTISCATIMRASTGLTSFAPTSSTICT